MKFIIIIFGHFNFIFEVAGNGCILKAKGPLLSASAIFNAFEIIDMVWWSQLLFLNYHKLYRSLSRVYITLWYNTTGIWECEAWCVFYTSQVFSNIQSVLSRYNTRLRPLHLLYYIKVILQKTIYKTCFFYVLHSDKTWVFDQSEHTQGPLYIANKI